MSAPPTAAATGVDCGVQALARAERIQRVGAAECWTASAVAREATFAGDRMSDHHDRVNRIMRLLDCDDEPPVSITLDDLADAESILELDLDLTRQQNAASAAELNGGIRRFIRDLRLD